MTAEGRDLKGLPALIDSMDYYILTAILNRPLHGLGIFEEVARRTNNQLVVIPGTLYAVLKRMSRDGWIEHVNLPTGAHSDERRKFFRATPLGRQLVAETAAWMEGELVRIRAELDQASDVADREASSSRDPPAAEPLLARER